MKTKEEKAKDLVEKQDISGLLNLFGLTGQEEEILEIARPSMRISTTKQDSTGKISRMGGRPYLPSGFVWPQTDDNRPLSFICQIELSEIGFWAERYFLPPEGVLAFFYDVKKQPWGFDPKEKDGWKVVYFDKLENMEEFQTPILLHEDYVFPQCSISFKEELTFPDFQDLVSENLEFAASDDYLDFVHAWYQKENLHRLLGYPQLIQNDLRMECNLAFNEVYVGRPEDYEKAKEGEYLNSEAAKNWELLLQIDTDDNTKMMWGDSGIIYYCIEKEKLLKQNFDDCWLILQCF